MSGDNGRALPKFGEWNVNNPAFAEGFTVIFNKARDEKKTTTSSSSSSSLTAQQQRNGELKRDIKHEHPRKSRKWFCCG